MNDEILNIEDFYGQLYDNINSDNLFKNFINKNINNNLKGKLYSEFKDVFLNVID